MPACWRKPWPDVPTWLAFRSSFFMSSPKQSRQPRIKEWLQRYLPAEILSVILTLISAGVVSYLTQNPVKTALAGTWGGNLAYFGYILIADIIHTKRVLHKLNQRYRLKSFLKNIRALLVEFGIAEVADSFFIRPLLMYYFPIWLNSLTWGILVAKLSADITFYVPAIISYEMSKKRLRKF